MNRTIATKVKTILGKKVSLNGYSDDGYYQSLVSEQGTRDEDLLRLLKIIASSTEGSDILDVGANIGYISCVLAKLYPGKVIHAFEPVPSNIKILQKNIDDNNLKNVIVHPFGLAQKAQRGSASWDPDNRGSAFITKDGHHEKYPESETVELKVLDKEKDKLQIKGCSLIKVDIEGFELEFLHGAKGFISEYKPTVVMEANHWCLNALQRITLPEFLDEVSSVFPYIHGFWGNKVLDVKEHTEIYMYENIVENRFLNLMCSFDRNQHHKTLETYKAAAHDLDYERSLPVNVIQDLRSDIEAKEVYEKNLRRAVDDQEQQIALLHNQQRDVRFLAKRLARELQIRLNNRARLHNSDNNLIYQPSKAIKENLGKSPEDKAQLLAFIQKQDQTNIQRQRPTGRIKTRTTSLVWRTAAKAFNGIVEVAKKLMGRTQ